MIRGFAIGLILILTARGLFADAASDSRISGEPLLIFWENSHYPAPSDHDFLGGLIAVVWPDGRIIRAVNNNQVGHNYVEGCVGKEKFKEFCRFLTSPNNLKTADIFSVAIDAPSQTFILYANNKKHRWTWGVPEKQKMLDEISARVWHLPMDKPEPVDVKKANFERFDPNKM